MCEIGICLKHITGYTFMICRAVNDLFYDRYCNRIGEVSFAG